MKKLLFIFNPTAGRAQLRNKLFEIIDFYTDHNYLVTLYPTQKRNDAYVFLTQSQDYYDLVVCGGGDGTLNEVISGVLDSQNNSSLSYIPCGSVNDFGRSIGISTNLEDALDVTINGKPYCIDIGKFNNHYFAYVAGFGIFTNVSYTTSQRMKNILGQLAYVLEGIKAISDLKSYSLTLDYNSGTIDGDFIIGLITNSFSVGGFKNPFRSVTALDDGIFEILLIQMPKSIMELQGIIKSLVNETFDSELIVCIQTSAFTIHSEPINWTFDGEYGGQYTNACISNLNQSLSIIVPETFH